MAPPSGATQAATPGSAQLGKANDLQKLLQQRLAELKRPVMAVSRSGAQIDSERVALELMQ